MEETRLIKVKEKIFRKIKKLFCKDRYAIKNVEKENNINIRKNIREELKVEIENDNTYQKKQFMKIISKNPELLEIFPLEILRKIRKCYEDAIKTKEELLKNINKHE